MEKDFNVHIFSLTPILCNLIMKSISHDKFIFNCTYIPENTNINRDKSLLDNLNISPDCIILDKDLDKTIKEEIIKRFRESEFICLPSLNENGGALSKSVQQMSEPLKISELGDVLNEIYTKKICE
jgi:hypothetical protein